MVLLIVYSDRRLQRLDPSAQPDRERLVADRRPAEAPPRPDPQPRGDRQGLRRPRAGDPRRRRSGPATRPIAAPDTPHAQAEADNQLTGALRQIFALSEAYPDLKANQNFLALQEELTATEGRVAYARQFYNDSVLDYNNKLQQFPTVIFANMLKFERREYFEADEAARTVPTVEF